MNGRKSYTAFPAGLFQDLQSLTIRAVGVPSFYQSIAINHFFERKEQ